MSSDVGFHVVESNVWRFVRTFLIIHVNGDTEAGKVLFCSVSENG